jgi:hypothetical protein
MGANSAGGTDPPATRLLSRSRANQIASSTTSFSSDGSGGGAPLVDARGESTCWALMFSGPLVVETASGAGG